MINFKILKSTEIPKDIRLSVHKTGKLGFSMDAKETLKLTKYKSITLAANADDENDKHLYLLLDEEEPEGSYKISKAGDYYYVNMGALLKSLGHEYSDGKLVVEMRKMEQGDTVYYRLAFSRKQINTQKPKMEENNEAN